jgi:hypothetical protein
VKSILPLYFNPGTSAKLIISEHLFDSLGGYLYEIRRFIRWRSTKIYEKMFDKYLIYSLSA